jgi:hypothetical protein
LSRRANKSFPFSAQSGGARIFAHRRFFVSHAPDNSSLTPDLLVDRNLGSMIAEPSGKSYTILHAEGGLAGTKPQLVGLPSKWRLISTENDVYLAKKVGTCLTVY